MMPVPDRGAAGLRVTGPDSTGPELAERLAFVAGSLNRRLRPPAEALTHIAVSALGSIERLGDVRPGDLARIEGIGASGMTRLIGDLEGRGLVARAADPADGRSQLIRLTDAGALAVAQARTARAKGVAAILETLRSEDRAVLDRALTALEQALLRTTPAR